MSSGVSTRTAPQLFLGVPCRFYLWLQVCHLRNHLQSLGSHKHLSQQDYGQASWWFCIEAAVVANDEYSLATKSMPTASKAKIPFVDKMLPWFSLNHLDKPVPSQYSSTREYENFW